MSAPVIVAHVVGIARAVRRQLQNERRHGAELTGACTLACARVCLELRDAEPMRLGTYLAGRRAETACGHAWLEVERYIIDPTATQFGRFPCVACIHPDTATHARYEISMQGREAMAYVWHWLDHPDKWHVEKFLRDLDQGATPCT